MHDETHIHKWAYKHKSILSQLNKSTDGNVMKIDDHCDRIEKNLSRRARKIRSELSKKASGRRWHILYNLFALENELESFEKITSERKVAIQRPEEWRQKVEQYKDEACQSLEDMAPDILSFSDELEI